MYIVSDTTSIYNYLIRIVDGDEKFFSDASVYENSLELGVNFSGTKMLKALSDRAYNLGKSRLGGIIYQAYKESDKRLAALLDYKNTVSVYSAQENSAWDYNKPIWAKSEDKDSALSHTFLQEEELGLMIASEIYNVIYKINWKKLFQDENNIAALSNNSNYGWEIRKECVQLTQKQIFGSKFKYASAVDKSDFALYFNREVKIISEVKHHVDYTLIYSAMDYVEVNNNYKVVVLPNY